MEVEVEIEAEVDVEVAVVVEVRQELVDQKVVVLLGLLLPVDVWSRSESVSASSWWSPLTAPPWRRPSFPLRLAALARPSAIGDTVLGFAERPESSSPSHTCPLT